MIEVRPIKNVPNYFIDRNGTVYDELYYVVKPRKNSCGYLYVILNDKIYTVAYLVANTFIDNPDNCICVGYIDNDYTNVKATNLFWYFDGIEEVEYEYKLYYKKIGVRHNGAYDSKGVVLVDINGKVYGKYNSINKCVKDTGFTNYIIHQSITNKIEIKDSGLFAISYDEYNDELIDDIIAQFKPHQKKIVTYKYYLISNENKLIKVFNGIEEAAKYFNKSAQVIKNKLYNDEEIERGLRVMNEDQFKVLNDYQRAYNQAIKRTPIGG